MNDFRHKKRYTIDKMRLKKYIYTKIVTFKFYATAKKE